MFNIAIIGGENTGDYEFFKNKCIHFLSNKVKEDSITIYSFGDAFVKKFSDEYKISLFTLYADWKTYGKEALKERTIRMANSCNGVILFAGGDKKTESFVESITAEKGVPLRIVKVRESSILRK